MKFDSPLALCPVCNEYVLTDQTQGECAREHKCGRRDCPLASAFTGHDFHGADAHRQPKGEDSTD